MNIRLENFKDLIMSPYVCNLMGVYLSSGLQISQKGRFVIERLNDSGLPNYNSFLGCCQLIGFQNQVVFLSYVTMRFQIFGLPVKIDLYLRKQLSGCVAVILYSICFILEFKLLCSMNMKRNI